ncbi:tyrosine-type recombinase/integrase [Planococcus sp. X10-3]|uniref:tyrosine-type recombinase/integrase n=1 Tax=Planococcus sp. X10-3 TaxID=3061240 RepID=UPI003BAF41C1
MTKTKSKKYEHVFWYLDKNMKKLWGYRYRYYDALGNRREKAKQSFTTEVDAYRKLLEIQTQVVNGDTKRVENSNLTVSEWLNIWYETHQIEWSISSQIQRRRAIELQMKPLLGKFKLGELDKNTYKRKYLNVLQEHYKPSTVKLYHRLFKIAVNAAVDDEIIPRNRFGKMTLTDEEINDNFLAAHELREFLNAAKHFENVTNYTFIYLLAYTGLRRGEAQGLQWRDISFDTKMLSVERTRDKNGVRKPKTKRSRRALLLDDLIIHHLKVYRTWCKKTKLYFGRQLKEDDFIFISHQSGKPIGDNTIKYSFERLFKETGIKRITPHGLRHTHATLLIMDRIPTVVVAARLGNTPAMIDNVYGHVLKNVEEESVHSFAKIMNQ